jgi:hypothetical protein
VHLAIQHLQMDESGKPALVARGAKKGSGPFGVHKVDIAKYKECYDKMEAAVMGDQGNLIPFIVIGTATVTGTQEEMP